MSLDKSIHTYSYKEKPSKTQVLTKYGMSTNRGYCSKISFTVGDLFATHNLRLLYVFSMPDLMVLRFSGDGFILLITVVHCRECTVGNWVIEMFLDERGRITITTFTRTHV